MSKAVNLIIATVLVLGVLYRLLLTSNGNFIFHMDSARDFIDVRQLVVLKKPSLIGPTSAIEGFYNGPGWYLLLAIPFILSGGNPYGAIVMIISFWAVGGFFLLKLVSRFGLISLIFAGCLWIASNFITLSSLYSFNPNPVTLLTPLFIYLLVRYIETRRLLYSILAWFLAGLFFNLEMNVGVFLPAVILASLVLSDRSKLLCIKNLLTGFIAFGIWLLPQFLFDLRHHFLMTRSVITYLSTAQHTETANLLNRFLITTYKFFNIETATFFNSKILVQFLLTTFMIYLIFLIRKHELKTDKVFLVSLLSIIVPFAGYVIIPVQLNPWHLGSVSAASILISSFLIGQIIKIKDYKRAVSFFLFIAVLFHSYINISNYFFVDSKKPNMDQSAFVNEISAIDYVYQKADGKNFKVYTYLPSVYDYPYQYLFWWHGLKRYGYLPQDYAYLPDKFEYIKNKDKFTTGANPPSSGLIFLIKEPDNKERRKLWENNFDNFPKVDFKKVGPLEIETRSQI